LASKEVAKRYRQVRNKAQVWVFEALSDMRERLPFPILGIHSDNGGEFINAEET